MIIEDLNEETPSAILTDEVQEQKKLEQYLKKVKDTYEPNRLVTYYLDERRKAKGKLNVDKRVIYELQDYFSVWELDRKGELKETLIPRLLLIDITASVPYLRRQGRKKVINGITGW